MSTLLVSTGVIALAEMGDKTQLLAFLLASRFKKPVPIVLGILAATLLNHGFAGLVGVWITQNISADVLRWVLSLSFILMAVWTLIPDKLDEDQTRFNTRLGVFGATLITFFLAEMGDKTQIATVAMAAHYGDVWMVVIGTTLGMLIADVPAVFVGKSLSDRLPVYWIHRVAAAIFLLLGLVTLFGSSWIFQQAS
ncbi:MAG TPA: TMEM165/GDT1 family protein [Limnobacter sp.]|nr:TMEM165/GDT1 family protein [Limnobacter sp.]